MLTQELPGELLDLHGMCTGQPVQGWTCCTTERTSAGSDWGVQWLTVALAHDGLAPVL